MGAFDLQFPQAALLLKNESFMETLEKALNDPYQTSLFLVLRNPTFLQNVQVLKEAGLLLPDAIPTRQDLNTKMFLKHIKSYIALDREAKEQYKKDHPSFNLYLKQVQKEDNSLWEDLLL